MSTLEILATLFGVTCVGLTIMRSLWCWPTGLAMVLCYIVIFYQAKLYSDMGLQVVYVGLQIYGWWYWAKRGRPDPSRRIEVCHITSRAALAWSAVAIVTTLALGTTMYRLTDASLPYWDATTTSLSLIAQWLMGRRVVESWLVWIAVDVLSIGIYLNRELYLTAVLYALFLVMAGVGFLTWVQASRARVVDSMPQQDPELVAVDG